MARAVAEVGSTNLVDLIERYNHPYWGFPPKQFYAEFLAAVEVGGNPSRAPVAVVSNDFKGHSGIILHSV